MKMIGLDWTGKTCQLKDDDKWNLPTGKKGQIRYLQAAKSPASLYDLW